MNTRESLFALIKKQLEERSYNVCTPAELSFTVAHEGFPIAIVEEPKLVAGSVSGGAVRAYDIGAKLLMQRAGSADKCAPIFALIEEDIVQVATLVAEAPEVGSVVLREVAPVAGALTHAGDVAMSTVMRVELFCGV